MPSPDSNPDRLTALELLFTHLQRDVETLSSAVLEQQKQFDAIRKVLEKFERRLSHVPDEGDSFDPVAERPPHY